MARATSGCLDFAVALILQRFPYNENERKASWCCLKIKQARMYRVLENSVFRNKNTISGCLFVVLV